MTGIKTFNIFSFQDGLPGPTEGAAGGDNTMTMMMMAWVVLAVVLYLFRPSSLRGDSKGGNGNGPGNHRDRDPMSDRDPPPVM